MLLNYTKLIDKIILTKMKNLFLKTKPTQILTISNNNFQTKFIHTKPQVNIGKKAINTVKMSTTDDL